MMTGPELYDLLWQAKAQQTWKTPLRGYATLCLPLTLNETVYNAEGRPIWKDGRPYTQVVDLAPGATVKVVMVSRLGDFGITAHLERHYGYALRVLPEDPRFTNWRLTQEEGISDTMDALVICRTCGSRGQCDCPEAGQ